LKTRSNVHELKSENGSGQASSRRKNRGGGDELAAEARVKKDQARKEGGDQKKRKCQHRDFAKRCGGGLPNFFLEQGKKGRKGVGNLRPAEQMAGAITTIRDLWGGK